MSSNNPAVLHQHFLKSRVRLLRPNPSLSITEGTPVKDAVKQLQLTNKGCMVIIDGQGQMTGIISERDILMKLALCEASDWNKPVQEFMTPNPRKIFLSASVARVLFEMATGHFRHLPIISSKKEDPVLMISIRDFLEFVHDSITQKISEDSAVSVVEQGSFDQFFKGSINLLNPQMPVVVRDILPIGDALERMKSVPIGAIVVLNEDQTISGIFSERDYIQRIALREDVKLSNPIQTVASKKVTTALESSSISLVFNLMAEGNFRHMPIVDDDEDLTGMLSLRNFIEYLSASILGELSDYESGE